MSRFPAPEPIRRKHPGPEQVVTRPADSVEPKQVRYESHGPLACHRESNQVSNGVRGVAIGVYQKTLLNVNIYLSNLFRLVPSDDNYADHPGSCLGPCQASSRDGFYEVSSGPVLPP